MACSRHLTALGCSTIRVLYSQSYSSRHKRRPTPDDALLDCREVPLKKQIGISSHRLFSAQPTLSLRGAWERCIFQHPDRREKASPRLAEDQGMDMLTGVTEAQ